MSIGKKIVPIKYTARDFTTIKGELVDYAKRYYSDSFKDFNQAGFGSLMLDTVSYVGDVLSFYADYNTNESHLKTSIEYNNILKHGYKLGFKYNPFASSNGVVSIYCLLPALTNGLLGPDYSYAPIVKKDTIFRAGPNTFTLTHDLDMKNPMRLINDAGQIINYQPIVRVARVDAITGAPTYYAIKAYGMVISGLYRTQEAVIGSFKRFAKITINESNIAQIDSIFDSDGNEYYEVDYLSQNIAYKPIPNSYSDSNQVQNILVPIAVPRRFVVERYDTSTSIVFGASSNVEVENDNMIEDPVKFVSQIYGRKYISDSSFDPKKLINSDKYGIGPSNTTLTINYRVNTVDNVNAAVGSVNQIGRLNLQFINERDLDLEKLDVVKSSFLVENEEPIVGDITIPTTEELKLRILDNFAAQNRAVTEKDYEAACYSMPAEFGALKRVKVVKDQQSFKRNLNLFVIAENSDTTLTVGTPTLKRNLKTWLNKNKIISDTIDIQDAKIINLSIDFEVRGVADKSKYDILNDCYSALRDAFSRKPEIGEPFLLTDVMYVLKKVDSIIDVKDVRVRKKTGVNYARINFNVDSTLGSCKSPDEATIEFPLNVIWEIKFPEADINGVVI